MAKSKFEAALGGTAQPLKPSTPASLLPLDAIQDRPQDTRPLNPKHVAALAESIVAVGLIEPLAVDQDGVLLAGGHRLAAIRSLAESDTQDYSRLFAAGVPVHRLPFKASEEPARALEVEVAENEKRRDYTPAEVRELADRLRQAGYTDRPGRPKAGEKAIGPALELIIGKHLRTVRGYLAGDPLKGMVPTGTISPESRQWYRDTAKVLGCTPADLQQLAAELLRAKAGKWATKGTLEDLRKRLGLGE